MDPRIVLMALALKSRNQATELRLEAAVRERAAQAALRNAEALEQIFCFGTDAQIQAAAFEVPL